MYKSLIFCETGCLKQISIHVQYNHIHTVQLQKFVWNFVFLKSEFVQTQDIYAFQPRSSISDELATLNYQQNQSTCIYDVVCKIGCPEKSVTNYHNSLRNNPKQCSSQDGYTVVNTE